MLKVCKFRKQGGQVTVVVALSLVAIIGSVGFAVDSGLGYMIRARLNTALDAATIAAANAVSQGATEAAQTANAQAAAQKFFAVNYPAAYLGSTVTFADPTVTFNQGLVTIDATASAALPVTFAHAMGINLLTVGSASQAIRKDLDMAFVIDASGSMLPSGPQVRSEAKVFLSRFDQLHDRMALVRFSVGAEVDDPIRLVNRGFDRASMNTHIDNIIFSGWTNSAEGFWNARNELNRITPAQRSTLRVVVFFSDGAPNSFSSQIKFKAGSSCLESTKKWRLPGSIVSDDDATGSVVGLGRIDRQNRFLNEVNNDPTCNFPIPIGLLPYGALPYGNETSSVLSGDAIPKFYNAHADPLTNVNVNEFPLADGGPRAVNNNPTYANVNRLSRNLVEAMADKARSEGIYVFTLGLGAQLAAPSGPDGENGDVVLKCMANSVDAKPGCIKANQPVGLYCFAVNANALKPCFEKLASAILRISK